MRSLRRRLTTRDVLNIQVALAIQIQQCIAKARDATSSHQIEVWSGEAASYITTYHQLAARNRRWPRTADQSARWAADLTAAVTAAVARAGTR